MSGGTTFSEGNEMLDATPVHTVGLGLRTATAADHEDLARLRLLSLQRLMAPALSETQRRTLHEYTEFDPRLVEDGTYYVLEVDGRIVASGGWSRRGALSPRGGDTAQEQVRDPSRDPAAIRAMYTDPDLARLGLGSILLAAAETAARLAGFGRAELIATAAGRELYLARGWRETTRITLGPDDGSAIEASLMERSLRSPTGQAKTATAGPSKLHATGVSGR
jgi:GNAT superfamily N-acetyltransferase